MEAGLGLFQKDDNTLHFTLVKRQDQHWLLALAEPGQPDVRWPRAEVQAYPGEIVLRMVA